MQSLLAIRFRQLPIRLGLQSKELAEKLSITPQMLIRYQKGEAVPSAEILVKIKSLFNFDMNWFLNERLKDEVVKTKIILKAPICCYCGA
jgi:transcriptional regulator with XRE-family HTH domain